MKKHPNILLFNIIDSLNRKEGNSRFKRNVSFLCLGKETKVIISLFFRVLSSNISLMKIQLLVGNSVKMLTGRGRLTGYFLKRAFRRSGKAQNNFPCALFGRNSFCNESKRNSFSRWSGQENFRSTSNVFFSTNVFFFTLGLFVELWQAHWWVNLVFLKKWKVWLAQSCHQKGCQSSTSSRNVYCPDFPLYHATSNGEKLFSGRWNNFLSLCRQWQSWITCQEFWVVQWHRETTLFRHKWTSFHWCWPNNSRRWVRTMTWEWHKKLPQQRAKYERRILSIYILQERAVLHLKAPFKLH